MLCMNVPHDIWTKIIACSNTKTKNALGKTCVKLHTLHSKKNLDLYIQDPLILTTDQKTYALSYCTYYNCVPAVENLLHHRAPICYVYCNMVSLPISIARYNKNDQLIKLLSRHGTPDENYARGYRVMSMQPYALAALMGDIETVRTYVKSDNYHPVYVTSEPSYKGATLLYAAIVGGHRDVVELLLSHKKTIRSINSGVKGSRRALDVAFLGGHADIVERLLTIPSVRMRGHDYCRRLLYNRAQDGHAACVQLLLKCKARYVNELSSSSLEIIDGKLGIYKSYTFFMRIAPLTIASFNGHRDVVELLLNCKKINVNISAIGNNDELLYNFTPLYAASLKGHSAIVKRLLQCPDINPLLYMKNYTPLHVACRRGHVEIVQLLVKHSPVLLQMNTKDTDESPLQLAQRYEHNEVVLCLLKL